MSIETLESGALFLGIDGTGSDLYQYIYREAAGVYWDAERVGFKSAPMNEFSAADWYEQIIAVVHAGLGVKLKLGPEVTWKGIGHVDRERIENGI